MNNASAVSRFKRFENLLRVSERLREGERTAKGYALDILHHQVIGPDIVESRDVWVVEGRSCTGLVVHSMAELFFRSFYGDNSIKPGVTGFEYLAHTT